MAVQFKYISEEFVEILRKIWRNLGEISRKEFWRAAINFCKIFQQILTIIFIFIFFILFYFIYKLTNLGEIFKTNGANTKNFKKFRRNCEKILRIR